MEIESKNNPFLDKALCYDCLYLLELHKTVCLRSLNLLNPFVFNFGVFLVLLSNWSV